MQKYSESNIVQLISSIKLTREIQTSVRFEIMSGLISYDFLKNLICVSLIFCQPTYWPVISVSVYFKKNCFTLIRRPDKDTLTISNSCRLNDEISSDLCSYIVQLYPVDFSIAYFVLLERHESRNGLRFRSFCGRNYYVTDVQ